MSYSKPKLLITIPLILILLPVVATLTFMRSCLEICEEKIYAAFEQLDQWAMKKD